MTSKYEYYGDAGESNPPQHRETIVNKEIMDPLPFPEIGTWRVHSSCRGEDVKMFFATGEVGRNKELITKRKEAIAICKGCPVSFQCLRYAVKNGIRWGVWGGKDMQSLKQTERIKLHKVFK